MNSNNKSFLFCLLFTFFTTTTIFILSILSIFTEEASTYSCKSPFGADVDWFVAYKLPKSSFSSNGTSFLYADSKNGGKSWIMSKDTIEDVNSAIGQTIIQIFEAKKSKTDLVALYNDENPNDGKTDSGRAHMKGVVVSSIKNGGFWLVHSVPKFPVSIEDKYLYPESGKRNGQSFFCLSFLSDALKQIGHQLYVAQPNFYDIQLPQQFEKYQDLANSLKKKPYPKGEPQFSVISLNLKDGTKIKSFSKNKRFAKDLYNNLVAPELKASLYTETWMVGSGDLPSDCETNFKIHNIQSIHFTKPFNNIKFENSKDHSKWAVTTTSSNEGINKNNNNWICIGDINRQKSQSKRGGGTVCMQNLNIANIYRSAIGDIECCINETECLPKKKNV